jgi:Uma2 family endonuclease
MAMPLPKVSYTVEDLAGFPDDGNRYEIIDGALFVTPAPRLRHQSAMARLLLRLLPYADTAGLDLFCAPADVRVSRRTQVEPDIFALPRMTDLDDTTQWVAMSRLLLAVEILSPSTKRRDREIKRRLYMAEGVREYWIVDIDARAVDVWVPGATEPRGERESLTWTPIANAVPLTISLKAVFAEIIPHA